MNRRNVVAAVLAAALVALSAWAPAAYAAGGGVASDSVSAEPVPGSHLSPSGYYLLDARPGNTLTQSLHVTNPNDHTVTVRVDPIDAVTSDVTGTAMRPPTSARVLTSRWIVVATPELILRPQEVRDVSFTVRVPPRTPPGQYVAGVSAWVPLTKHAVPAAPGKKQAAFSMDIQFQRAIAVEVDVPGPRAPKLVVTGAEPQVNANGVTLGVHIANQGNAFAHGHGVVRVADTRTDFSFKINTFVSGTAIVYPVPWTSSVKAGVHHVEVDLDYEGGRRTTWNGIVTISGDLANQLQSDLAKITVPKKGGGINWLLVAAILVVIGLVVGAVLLRRHARRPTRVKYRAA